MRVRILSPASATRARLPVAEHYAVLLSAFLRKQIQSFLDKEWDVAIEQVERERAHKTYWYMWKLPLFGEWNIDTIMNEINACRNAYPGHHNKIIGYNDRRQTQGMAMFVHRTDG